MPALLVLAGLGACAAVGDDRDPVGASTPGGWTAAVLRGDWDDLRAAVLHAASRNELALVRADEPEPGVQRFELLSIREERVELVARLAGSAAAETGAAPGPVAIEAAAFFHPFGDEPRQRRLLGEMRGRLRDLAGVAFHPAR